MCCASVLHRLLRGFTVKNNPFLTQYYARRSEAATRFARATKSDPHAYNRAMSHSYTGIAGSYRNEDGKTTTAFYDADTYAGHQAPDSRWDGLKPLREKMGLRPLDRVDCTAYRNVQRP